MTVQFENINLEDISPFCEATDTPTKRRHSTTKRHSSDYSGCLSPFHGNNPYIEFTLTGHLFVILRL